MSGKTKFKVGDRVALVEKMFPSYDHGLFDGMAAKTGKVVEVNAGSILPYRAVVDGFEHHPFWFYEDQLMFEDPEKEEAWKEANKPKPSPRTKA